MYDWGNRNPLEVEVPAAVMKILTCLTLLLCLVMRILVVSLCFSLCAW